jgi:hypothetical protein
MPVAVALRKGWTSIDISCSHLHVEIAKWRKVTMTKAFLATLSLVVMATSASAETVCNGAGDCWHAKEHAWIRPEHGLVIHPDNWKWEEHEREKFRWREHEGRGRGYWHEGRWIEIR